MTDEERYLFDCRGYIVVEGALSSAELDTLNEVFDEIQGRSEHGRDGRARYHHLINWDKSYRDLIDHGAIYDHLNEMLSGGFRLDHEYAEHMNAGGGGELHFNGTPYNLMGHYTARDGKMQCGLVAVVWALKDWPPGAGGLCCIPGSHKSAFLPPDSITCVGTPSPGVQQVPCKAGSVVIFTEALRHGTMNWTAPTQRRSLFYKYSPRNISWWGTNYDPDAHDYTDRQRSLLRAPYSSQTWDGPTPPGYIVTPS